MAINSVTLSGNLTRDAELKTVSGGLSVLNINLAVNERVKDKTSGQWKNYPNYVNCTMFGARAQSVAQYLTKGTHVTIQGKLHYSSWQGSDGKKQSNLSVTVDDVDFSGSNRGAAPQVPQQMMPAGAVSPAQAIGSIPSDMDTPF